MRVGMIKNFTIDAVRINPDKTKTVFFTVKKSIVNPDRTVSNRGLQSTYVVDAEYSDADIEEKVFNLLDKEGWI
jgi:hypothetical protein